MPRGVIEAVMDAQERIHVIMTQMQLLMMDHVFILKKTMIAMVIV